MDLESVEDNEVIISERLGNFGGKTIETNGSCGSGSGSDSEHNYEVRSYVDSSPPATTKGYGLKKWRRIRREFKEDGSGSENLDTSKILKRGLAASAENSTRPQGLSVETRHKSGSLPGSSRLPGGPNFAGGTDSGNSEDRSSKPSTAASAPRARYEIPAAVSYARDMNGMKSLNGKNVVNLAQRGGQQGKSRVETSKKPRGERLKIEKENSHSSGESDSRSFNFVFVQSTNSVTSNGRQSGRSTNDDGDEENSDEAQGGEQHCSEEIRTGYKNENVEEFEDLSQEGLADGLSWEVKEGKAENHGSSTDLDPLVESIFTLQSAREALEREVEKFREIGNEQFPLFDSSTEARSSLSEFASGDKKIHEASSSEQLHAGETRHVSNFSEKQVISLKQNVNFLESKLEEANAVLKAKDAKVIELEYALNSNDSPKGEMWSTLKSQQKKYREMEAELEGLFKQKIEAEVEYLAISGTTHKLRVAAVFDEQNTLALGQPQIVNGLGDAESKAERPKRLADKLVFNYEDLRGTDQVLRLQKRVWKVTLCFFVQSILLFVGLALFFLQLSAHHAGVVPT